MARRARSSVMKPMSGVDGQDGRNREGFHVVTEGERNAGSRDQQIHDHALELIAKNVKRRNRLWRLEAVGAHALEHSPGFFFVEAGAT